MPDKIYYRGGYLEWLTYGLARGSDPSFAHKININGTESSETIVPMKPQSLDWKKGRLYRTLVL
jgi:hypothetical protein